MMVSLGTVMVRGAFQNFRRFILAILIGLCMAQAVCAQSPAFWRAIETNDVNVLRTELMRGANPNARHPDLGPAIVAAARFKAFDVVRVLASLNATDVDAASVADETALMLVSTLGDRHSFDALLQRGAQVNRPGWTPLHYAASGGQLELVKLLIEHHAFIDAQSPNNTTPLMMAARMRALPIVQYLIDQGADPSIKNQAGLDAAAYLERTGERQWAIWMRERVSRYVARYGTVEQPRWTAHESAEGSSGSASNDLAPVRMSREVNVAPDARQQNAAQPAAVGATPGPVSPPAAAAPAGQKPSPTPARPMQLAPPALAKPASPPAIAPPGPVSPVAPAAKASPPSPSAASGASSSPPSGFRPIPPVPPAAAKPVAPTAPATTAGGTGPGPSTQAKDTEPLFFSRTLSIPADPPSSPSATGR